MIFIKYCKKCGSAYDFGINFNICPKCRLRNIQEMTQNKQTILSAQRSLSQGAGISFDRSERRMGLEK